ncbi:hypothetical protein L1887_56947 [Cichorium endivia]|nr:hypothetical protein L1887_56947 [Cichorium endivia]
MTTTTSPSAPAPPSVRGRPESLPFQPTTTPIGTTLIAREQRLPYVRARMPTDESKPSHHVSPRSQHVHSPTDDRAALHRTPSHTYKSKAKARERDPASARRPRHPVAQALRQRTRRIDDSDDDEPVPTSPRPVSVADDTYIAPALQTKDRKRNGATTISPAAPNNFYFRNNQRPDGPLRLEGPNEPRRSIHPSSHSKPMAQPSSSNQRPAGTIASRMKPKNPSPEASSQPSHCLPNGSAARESTSSRQHGNSGERAFASDTSPASKRRRTDKLHDLPDGTKDDPLGPGPLELSLDAIVVSDIWRSQDGQQLGARFIKNNLYLFPAHDFILSIRYTDIGQVEHSDDDVLEHAILSITLRQGSESVKRLLEFFPAFDPHASQEASEIHLIARGVRTNVEALIAAAALMRRAMGDECKFSYLPPPSTATKIRAVTSVKAKPWPKPTSLSHVEASIQAKQQKTTRTAIRPGEGRRPDVDTSNTPSYGGHLSPPQPRKKTFDIQAESPKSKARATFDVDMRDASSPSPDPELPISNYHWYLALIVNPGHMLTVHGTDGDRDHEIGSDEEKEQVASALDTAAKASAPLSPDGEWTQSKPWQEEDAILTPPLPPLVLPTPNRDARVDTVPVSMDLDADSRASTPSKGASPSVDLSQTFLIIFDSLEGEHKNVDKKLYEYLWREALDKKRISPALFQELAEEHAARAKRNAARNRRPLTRAQQQAHQEADIERAAVDAGEVSGKRQYWRNKADELSELWKEYELQKQQYVDAVKQDGTADDEDMDVEASTPPPRKDLELGAQTDALGDTTASAPQAERGVTDAESAEEPTVEATAAHDEARPNGETALGDAGLGLGLRQAGLGLEESLEQVLSGRDSNEIDQILQAATEGAKGDMALETASNEQADAGALERDECQVATAAVRAVQTTSPQQRTPVRFGSGFLDSLPTAQSWQDVSPSLERTHYASDRTSRGTDDTDDADAGSSTSTPIGEVGPPSISSSVAVVDQI